MLEAGASRAVFLPDDGARLAELVLDGHRVLVEHVGQDAMWWGAFVMAPWTSLLRRGEFEYDGATLRLEPRYPDDLWHGVARRARWWPRDDGGLSAPLRSDWPLGGSAWLVPRLGATWFELTIGVRAGECGMPAAVGWHPWFVRRLGSYPVALVVSEDALAQERDDRDAPTGRWVTPTRQWNDCVRTDGPFDLVYGHTGTLRISSTGGYATLFSMHEQDVCVEPVTSPAERMDDVLAPGQSIEITIRLDWIDG